VAQLTYIRGFFDNLQIILESALPGKLLFRGTMIFKALYKIHDFTPSKNRFIAGTPRWQGFKKCKKMSKLKIDAGKGLSPVSYRKG